MKKRIVFTVMLMAVICVYSTLRAQTSAVDFSGRYIVVEDVTSFFFADEVDNSVINCHFDLYNIYENESSKPVFVDVNELSNVILFGIKSNSDKYENRRACTLQMTKVNYKSTFRLVLNRMKVEKVLYQGVLIDVIDFFEIIK
jgi:hypothetical protein